MIDLVIVAPGDLRDEWRSPDWQLRHAATIKEALALLEQQKCDVLLIEAEENDESELSVLDQILFADPGTDLVSISFRVSETATEVNRAKIEELVQWIHKNDRDNERERTRKYGSPAKRERELLRYFKELRAQCPDEIVLQLLKALGETEDFIPASRLKETDWSQAQLSEIIRCHAEPWFIVTSVEKREAGAWEIAISHGINMAASGETFLCHPDDAGFRVAKRWRNWIS